MVSRILILTGLSLLIMIGLPGWANDVKQKPVTKSGLNLSAAYNAYVMQVRPMVLSHWSVPDGTNLVTLTVKVTAEGATSDVVLSSSPKNNAAEQAAQDALTQAQPLPVLPASSPPVELTLTFKSMSDPHGDSSSNLVVKLDQLKP